MDDLPGPNGRQIPISLVGEYDCLRTDSLEPGGNCRPPAVKGHDHIAVKLTPVPHRTSRRCDTDCPSRYIELVHHLRDKSVDGPMGATRAVGKGNISHGSGFFKDPLHRMGTAHI